MNLLIIIVLLIVLFSRYGGKNVPAMLAKYKDLFMGILVGLLINHFFNLEGFNSGGETVAAENLDGFIRDSNKAYAVVCMDQDMNQAGFNLSEATMKQAREIDDSNVYICNNNEYLTLIPTNLQLGAVNPECLYNRGEVPQIINSEGPVDLSNGQIITGDNNLMIYSSENQDVRALTAEEIERSVCNPRDFPITDQNYCTGNNDDPFCRASPDDTDAGGGGDEVDGNVDAANADAANANAGAANPGSPACSSMSKPECHQSTNCKVQRSTGTCVNK